MTGVVVRLRSTVSDLKLRSKIHAGTALQNAEPQIENDQEELDSGTGLEWKGILPQWKSCSRVYRNQDSYEIHKENCHGSDVKVDKNVMNRAPELALRALDNGPIKIQTDKEDSPLLKDIEVCALEKELAVFKKGWARSPDQGKNPGNNNIQPFIHTIHGLLLAGVEEKGKIWVHLLCSMHWGSNFQIDTTFQQSSTLNRPCHLLLENVRLKQSRFRHRCRWE